jgi:ketosteroid isomerase-like protein
MAICLDYQAKSPSLIGFVTIKEMTMSMDLPKPIAAYVEANFRLDIDGMSKPFLADAVFIDNGKHFEGQAAIRHLFEEEVIPVEAIFTPDTVREEAGDVVVEGPAHGNFPGSPLRFTYRFTLVDGAIAKLEVTGGTKGLGRATVERFLADGARVITAARSIRYTIEGVEYVQADLTTAEGGETLAKVALERLGGIDILAHVIGGSASAAGGFAALTDDHWLAELSLNLLATVRLDRLLIPQMLGRGHCGSHHLDPVRPPAARIHHRVCCRQGRAEDLQQVDLERARS